MGWNTTFLYKQNTTSRLNKWLDGIIPSGLYFGFDFSPNPGLNFSFSHDKGYLVTPLDTKAAKIPTSIIKTRQGVIIQGTGSTPTIKINPTTDQPRTDAVVMNHAYVKSKTSQKEPVVVTLENVSGQDKSNIEEYAESLDGHYTLIGFLHLPMTCDSLDHPDIVFEKRSVPLLAGQGTLSRLADYGFPTPKVLGDYQDTVLPNGFYQDQKNDRLIISSGGWQLVQTGNVIGYRTLGGDSWSEFELAHKDFLTEQYVNKSQKAKPGGVATLDDKGKVPEGQLNLQPTNDNISKEIQDRKDADAALSNDINALGQVTNQALGNVNSRVDGVEQAVQALEGRMDSAENRIKVAEQVIKNLGDSLVQETGNRQAAIDNLEKSLIAEINKEASIRSGKDNQLQGAINTNAQKIGSLQSTVDKHTIDIAAIKNKMGGQYFEWLAPALVDLSASTGEGGFGFLSSNPQDGIISNSGEGASLVLNNSRASHFVGRNSALYVTDNYPDHSQIHKTT